jgi:Fe-S-cluster containining protein
MSKHPCLSCGACCAYYRVSFYSSEISSDRLRVPEQMVVSINADESVMKGTDKVEDTRCIALSGLVGTDARCSIYKNRPSPCRRFQASFEYGAKEPRCDEARKIHGLAALTLRDYDAFRNREIKA